MQLAQQIVMNSAIELCVIIHKGMPPLVEPKQFSQRSHMTYTISARTPQPQKKQLKWVIIHLYRS